MGVIEPFNAAANATCETLKNHEKVGSDVITRRACLSNSLIFRPFLGHRVFVATNMSIVETSAPAATGALPLWLVTEGTLQGWLAEASAEVANWVRANGFLAEKQRVLM